MRGRRRRYAPVVVCTALALVTAVSGCGGDHLRWSDRYPAWSPDGRRVAFASSRADRTGNFDLYVVSANGGDTRRLTRLRANGGLSASELSKQLLVTRPLWSADGRWLAFTVEGYPCDGFGCHYVPLGLFVIRHDGSRLRRLTHREPLDLSWSPHGSTLAANLDERLIVLEPAGVRRDLGSIGQSGLRWITASRLALVREASFTLVELGKSSVERMTVRVHGAPEAGEIALSPNAGRVAFRGKDGALYLAAADGSNARKVLGRVALLYAWSPNGRQLAFMKYRDVTAAEVYLVNSDGSHLHKLSGGDYDAVRWSPHGFYVELNRGSGSAAVPVSGGSARQIAWDAAWSHDDTKIVFSTSSTGIDPNTLEKDRAALYVMNLSNKHVELLTQQTS